MEALTGQPVASPALHHLTLRVLSSVDTWTTDPGRVAFQRLVEEADDDDVSLLPDSIGAVLPLLEGMPERLRAAMDLIVKFDLFEAARGLSILIWRGHPAATLAGACLYSNPGVSEEFRDLISAHAHDLVESWERDLYLTRLNADHVPESDAARVDRRVRWLPNMPGDALFAAAGVPAGDADLDARTHFRIILDLVAAGVVVRRWPIHTPVERQWLPKWVPVVNRSKAMVLRPDAAPHERQRLVRNVFAPVPRAWRERHPLVSEPPPPPGDLTDIEVFDDGAIPRREVAYLAGMRPAQFASLRRFESLQPFHFRGTAYWRFSQVVGLRAAQYLFSLSDRKRGMGFVADRLVQVASNNSRVPAGVTTDGRVLVFEGGVLYDVESGQLADEGVITFTDQVYRPFPLEDRLVPGLLRPSRLTSVHPGIVRGLPCVEGTRVTVGAVAHALSAARSSNRDDPTEFAAASFGLDPEQVRDAEGVANAIAAAP